MQRYFLGINEDHNTILTIPIHIPSMLLEKFINPISNVGRCRIFKIPSCWIPEYQNHEDLVKITESLLAKDDSTAMPLFYDIIAGLLTTLTNPDVT